MALNTEKTFLNVFEELRNTSGTNDKKKILKDNKNIFGLQTLLDYALNNTITFGIANFEYKCKNAIYDNNRAFENFNSLAFLLKRRELTGNEAIAEIQKLFSRFNEKQAFWFHKILTKDLSIIGIGRTIFAEAFELNNYKFKVNLAEEEKELSKFDWSDGASIEIKLNGVRTLVCIENGDIAWIKGRSGIEIENFYPIVEDIKKAMISSDSFILDGEVHCQNSLEDTMTVFGTMVDKDRSDFKTDKAYQKWVTEKQEIALALRDKCTYDVFDIIPIEEFNSQICTATYLQRREALGVIQKRLSLSGVTKVRVVESFPVKDKDEAVTVANNFMSFGLEGGILKANKAKYEYKRARNFIKIKESTDEMEAQIIGYTISKDIYTTSGEKDLDQLGAFKIKYKNPSGTYSESEVGTGNLLTKAFKQDVALNPNSWIDKIITVQAQRFSEDGILICPRVLRMRPDRTSLEE